MFFKLLVWLGKKFEIEGAPLCRVWNDRHTEHYTLNNDGWIIISAPRSKSHDMVHISCASSTLHKKFEAALTA